MSSSQLRRSIKSSRNIHDSLFRKRRAVAQGLAYALKKGHHLIRERTRIAGILFFILLTLFLLRNVIMNNGLIFYWDSVPFVSSRQLAIYTFDDWDAYLQRSNYRFSYSIFTNWMLLAPLQRLALFLAFFLVGYSCFELTQYVQKTATSFPRRIITFSSIVSGTIYLLFISMSYAHRYSAMMIAAGIQPLIFLCFLKSVNEKTKWAAPLSLLIFINPFISIMLIDVTLIFVFSFFLIVNGFLKKQMMLTKKVIITNVIILIFGIIPYIVNITLNVPIDEMASIEMRDLVTTKGNVLSILVPFSMYLPETIYGLYDIRFYLLRNPIHFIFLLYPLLTIICYIIKYDKKQPIILFTIGMILSGIASLGTDFILSPYYVFMRIRELNPVLKTILDAYVMVLRKPEKWYVSEALFLIVLASISVSMFLIKLQSKKVFLKKVKIIFPHFSLVVAFLFLLLISPFFVSPFNLMFTGDIGKTLSPIAVPEELETVHDLIEHDEKTLYLPIHTWSRPTTLLGYKRVSDELFIFVHDVESIEAGGGDSNPLNVKFLAPICRRLYENKSRYLGKILSLAGIKYVVFDSGVEEWPVWPNETKVLLNSLLRQNDLELIHRAGSLYVFRNQNFTSNTILMEKEGLLVFDGPSDEALDLAENTHLVEEYALVYADEISLSELESLKEKLGGRIVLYAKNLEDALLNMLAKDSVGKILTPDLDPYSWIKHEDWRFYSFAFTSQRRLDWFYDSFGTWGEGTLGNEIIATNESATFNFDFTVESDEFFSVYLKLFTENGTRIRLAIDNSQEQVINISETENFSFVKLMDANLEEGFHSISISMLQGSLVLDILYLLPDHFLDKTTETTTFREMNLTFFSDIDHLLQYNLKEVKKPEWTIYTSSKYSYAPSWTLKLNNFTYHPYRSWLIHSAYLIRDELEIFDWRLSYEVETRIGMKRVHIILLTSIWALSVCLVIFLDAPKNFIKFLKKSPNSFENARARIP